MLAGITLLVVAAIPIIQTKMPLEEDMFLYWRRSEPSECKPFTSYKVDCNKCVCSADGVAYCTRMACFSKESAIHIGKDLRKKRKNGSSSNSLLPFTSQILTDDTKSQSPSDPDDSTLNIF